MPISTKVFDNFSGGLFVSSPRDTIPMTALRRARGVRPPRSISIKSRWGGMPIYGAQPSTPHSITRFKDVRFHGVGTTFRRNNADIKTGLDGSRLSFVRMPPTAGVSGSGIDDYLFVAGGGTLFKVDAIGNVTNWGITAPIADFTAGQGSVGPLTGTYKYHITFLNTATGSRSNSNPNSQSVTLAARQGFLSGIPLSADSQVNAREVWRTVAGGEVFFRAAIITNNVATTFTDTVTDANLETLELQFDNIPPFAEFDDAVGPYLGRMWWTRRITGGEEGRIYYSPNDRAEVVQGFIEASTPDDPMQKIVVWAETLWGFSENHVYRILGSGEPFIAREVWGSPGTTKPYTIVPTPVGIIYDSNDGVRLFNGSTSRLVGSEAVGTLFVGESSENLTAFEGVVAEYGRSEYVISDLTQTLALDVNRESWRDVGLGLNTLYYEVDIDKFLVAKNLSISTFDDENVVGDDGVAITFEVETASAMIDLTQEGLVKFIEIEYNTNGQSLTPQLILDGTTYPYPALVSSVRTRTEIPIERSGRVVSVRLTGNLLNEVEIFKVTLAAHVG